MSDDLVSLTQALVRIPSPAGGEGEVASFVAQNMAASGFDEVNTDQWGNVVGVRHTSKPGPALLFDGHMDVVDPGPERWAHDPYGATIEGGRLWGRGAADTKGSLAAMISAAAAAPLEQLNGDIIVAATVCEENLTGVALGHVLDRYPADVVITGEPTGLRLGVAQKGRATFRLYAKGRSAHTSRPELGDNAVYKMIDAIQRLRALSQPVDPELGAGVLELVEIVSEPLPNQTLVPPACHARFVARTLPGDTAGRFVARHARALAGMNGISLVLDTLHQNCYTGALLEAVDFLPSWHCPADDPIRLRILDALASAGLPSDTLSAPCGTNASESAGRRGIRTFIYGPGSLAEAHITEEWVAVDELHRAQAGYEAIIRCVLSTAAGNLRRTSLQA